MNLRKVQSEKGVTIVALAIIIVILIILAGVTINATIGEGGLIKQAQYASEQMANSTAYEQEQLNKLTGDLANITEGGEITPPDPGEEIPEGTITIGEPEWAGDGTASVTVSTSESEYILQYQINGTDEGGRQTVQGGKVTGLHNGDTVYARLTDGINHGDYASVTILDGTPPTVSISEGEITENSITVNVTANDGQSGLATTGTYKYYINDSLEATTEATTYTFSGLKAETEYTIKVEAIDKANNAGENIITTSTKAYPQASTTLKKGNYVTYPSAKGNLTCRVLYENTSGYGLQIITSDSVDNNVVIGYDDPFVGGTCDQGKIKASYNKAITKFNNLASNYNNNLYGTARCVGTDPRYPSKEGDIDNTGLRVKDENYKSDYNQMNILRILITSHDYWLGSRDEVEVLDGMFNEFCIRQIQNGKLVSVMIDKYNVDVGNNSQVSGLRPVFILNSNIKVTGGNGSQNSPYT